VSATVDLPDVSAARYWRIVASDNATEVEAWVVAGMKFFVADQHVAHVPYVPLPLDGGGIASGGAGSPQSAFDGNQETFWVSGERGQAVRGQAWLGYGFAAPQAVRQIRIRQTSNPRFRQDLVAVEKSMDAGATWLPAASNLVRLPGSIAHIDLPEGEPARLWRVVAAGENAVSPEDAWSVFELGFYAPEDKINRPPVVALDLSGGEAISSGEGSGLPQRAFDGMPDTFWVSAERGPSVRGQAWIGYSFGALQAVRHIRIRQPTNAPYRQDVVRVEKSVDGGASWKSAAPEPFRLEGEVAWIDLPEGEAARLWRVVAASDNATSPDHAWAVQELDFFARESPDRSAVSP